MIDKAVKDNILSSTRPGAPSWSKMLIALSHKQKEHQETLM